MTKQKTETGQEQRLTSRSEMVELISYEGYKPVTHRSGTSFLDEKGRVVGRLPENSIELIIEYGKTFCETSVLNRETLLAQGEFYRACRSIGFSVRETYV